VWQCGGGDLESWCGSWDESNNGEVAIFFSHFKHYIYTPGDGPNGSDFTLEFSDDFDGTEYDTDAWYPYGVQLGGGFSYGGLGAEFTGELPEDQGDVPVVCPSNVCKAGIKTGGLEYKSGNITFSVAMPGPVNLSVFDLSGKLVRTLDRTYRGEGMYTVKSNLSGIPSGSYILSLKTAATLEARRIIRK
jgi:hypothetical protein